MSLHSEIMNIETKIGPDCGNPFDYKLGHRDARHAAAELSLKAEGQIDELEFLLKKSLAWLSSYQDCHGQPDEISQWVEIVKGKLR